MANTTRTNIQRKRKKMRRKRRVRFFRLLVVVIIMGAIFVGVVFVGYSLFQWGSHIFADYQAMYAGYTERMERQRGAVDPRFDGYTNVLILGLDDGVGSDNSGLQAADTIILASLENDTGRVRFITIPRDTWVGQTKISSLYANYAVSVFSSLILLPTSSARLSPCSTKLFPNTRNFFPIPSASLPSNF